VSDFVGVSEILKSSRRLLVTSHESPDGDALGSMLGLGLSLEPEGKEVEYYNASGVPPHLDFLPYRGRVKSVLNEIPGSFDATIILDCTDIGRVGEEFLTELETGRMGRTVIIDHHSTRVPSADMHVLFPCAAATGIIVFSLIKYLGLEITSDIATSLYTAIVSDTGSFSYENTGPEALRVAAELIERGASPSYISEAIYQREPISKIKLLGLALPTIELSEGGDVASITVDGTMFERTSSGRVDTEGFVNIPRSIKGVKVAVLFREVSSSDNEGKWKISLRSKGEVNVAAVAEKLGGGGHERAAGCSIRGSIEHAKENLFDLLREELGWKV